MGTGQWSYNYGQMYYIIIPLIVVDGEYIIVH